MQIKEIPFALSLGILWSLTLVVMGMASYLFGYATPFLEMWSSVYIGLEPTPVGIMKGALMGFIDLGTSGLCLAFMYNAFCRLIYKKTNQSKESSSSE